MTALKVYLSHVGLPPTLPLYHPYLAKVAVNKLALLVATQVTVTGHNNFAS